MVDRLHERDAGCGAREKEFVGDVEFAAVQGALDHGQAEIVGR